MKLILTVAVVILAAAASSQQTSTTVHHSDGTQTTVTCSGGQNADCYVRDSTDDDWNLFRDKAAYCIKGLKMPKDQVLPKGRGRFEVSAACDEAFDKKLIEGPVEGDCQAMGKKFNRNARECK